MRFGIFDHLDRGEVPLDRLYEERIQLIERADMLGIASYHIAEHHWNPVGMAPLPGVFLGAAAMRTKKIRLGPLAYALAFHNPLILAEEICMLDHMSGGRFDLGVGRGISPWELAHFGLTMVETRDIFREAMEVMLQYFTADKVTHRGELWNYRDVPVEIKPLQRPFPPLWYGSSSGSTRDYVAGLGSAMIAGWAPNAVIKTAAEAYRLAWENTKNSLWRAHCATEATIGSVRMLVIAETDAEAEALAQPAHDLWNRNLQKLAKDFGFASTFIAPTYDLAKKAGYVIAGATDTVRTALATHIEASGVNYVLLQLAFGSLSHEQSLRSLELFVREIQPQLFTRTGA